ncbi:MAG: MFS transporter [Marmoricola sp.]
MSTDDGGSDAPTPRRGFAHDLRTSVAAVAGNRNLRRVQLAFVGSSIGDWAYGTAVAVWAYGEGGAKAVGVWMAIRFALMAVSAPFTAGLADKMPRKRLMILADLIRALLVTGAAACLYFETPAAPIYVLATLTSLLGTPFMVAQRSLLPSLAERPEELTAANGTASTIESLAFFAGPALAALLIGVTSLEVVFLVNVATFGWSMLLVMGLSIPSSPDGARDQDEPPDVEPAGPGFLAETSAGFRTIAGDSGLILVAAAASVQTIIAGASTVFMLVMADELVGIGPKGLGYLDSVLGIGSILGGMLAISRAAKGRLGSDMAAGVLLWSAPLLLVTLWPSPVTCFAVMAMLGLGNPLVDVNLDTIIQRLSPDAVLGRVFGALEACFIATMALGAAVMPFMIEWLDLRYALLVVAGPVVLMTLAMIPALRRLETRLGAPANLALISAVDIFAPLASPVVESLARAASELAFKAGEELVRQGGVSDTFFVIQSGLVEVTQGERVLRREGPGEYFGEIGLLRDVPRTATITAVEDTVVQAIEREEFLQAVSGHNEARRTAENIANRRLAM